MLSDHGELGKLGNWEIGKLGNWDMSEPVTCGTNVGTVMRFQHTFGAWGGWEIGKLGNLEIGA